MNQLLRFLQCGLLFNFREGKNASGSSWRDLGVHKKNCSSAGVYKGPKGSGITGRVAVVPVSTFLPERLSGGAKTCGPH